jgi:hypothetical protein
MPSLDEDLCIYLQAVDVGAANLRHQLERKVAGEYDAAPVVSCGVI